MVVALILMDGTIIRETVEAPNGLTAYREAVKRQKEKGILKEDDIIDVNIY